MTALKTLRSYDKTSALIILMLGIYAYLFFLLPILARPWIDANNSWLFLLFWVTGAVVAGDLVYHTHIDDWLLPVLIFLLVTRVWNAHGLYQIGNSASFIWIPVVWFLLCVWVAIALLATHTGRKLYRWYQELPPLDPPSNKKEEA